MIGDEQDNCLPSSSISGVKVSVLYSTHRLNQGGGGGRVRKSVQC